MNLISQIWIYIWKLNLQVSRKLLRKKKNGTVGDTRCIIEQPLQTVQFNISMVRKMMLDMEKLLEINMSTCHAF